MSEKALRNTFLIGTAFFFAIFVAMTVDSLSQVLSTRTPPLTGPVVAGKRVWQSKNCNDCHTILGIGGYYAPELTKVADRRGAAWLRQWLKDPKAVSPAATMPNQKLSNAQIEDLAAFLQWVSQIDTNNWPPQPLSLAAGAGEGTSSATAPGMLLFEQKGCSGCHLINGRGTAGPGPDLSHIGSVPYDSLPNTAEFLSLWLADPKAQKPDTPMPRLPLSQPERETLVDYLTQLK
jgi:nitric oxide reductase subunit C